VTAPVLIFHGDNDSTIPIAFGQRLYSLINAPKCFIRFANGGHIDLDDRKILTGVRDFIVSGMRGCDSDGGAITADLRLEGRNECSYLVLIEPSAFDDPRCFFHPAEVRRVAGFIGHGFRGVKRSPAAMR
jgi:hypothetical protein